MDHPHPHPDRPDPPIGNMHVPAEPPPAPMMTASPPAVPTPAPALVTGPSGGPAASRGYQWKQLFLPNGTELRTIYCGRSTYAIVEDEQIISEGKPTTPSRLANRQGCGCRTARAGGVPPTVGVWPTHSRIATA